MIKNICFWLKNSRLFSLPMTLLSWSIIFIYSLKYDGNILNGILALIGISFAHLATNLFDDYMDYQKITAGNSQVCKCSYIRDGKATIEDVLRVVVFYLSVAFVVGIILTFRCGVAVVGLAVLGGIITLIYSKLSQIGLSEIAVGTAFGPLLFEGVFYVMTGNFSFEVLFLSLAVVMFTVGLMYTHTVLDYEGDAISHKKTLVCRLGSKKRAINGVWVVYGLGYLFTLVLILMTKNYCIFATFLLLPLVYDLWNSLNSFECGGEAKEFYFRLLKARNLMVYYSVIIMCCILLVKTVR